MGLVRVGRRRGQAEGGVVGRRWFGDRWVAGHSVGREEGGTKWEDSSLVARQEGMHITQAHLLYLRAGRGGGVMPEAEVWELGTEC